MESLLTTEIQTNAKLVSAFLLSKMKNSRIGRDDAIASSRQKTSSLNSFADVLLLVN